MKKFRLFALLAVLATFSTVFAAWQYYSYDVEVTSNTVSIKVDKVNSDDAIEVAPIEIVAATDSELKISFEQDTTNPYFIKGVASGPVTVEVNELEEGASDKYTYSFAVYNSLEGLSSEYLPSEENAQKISLTLTDGVATISAEEIASLFDYELYGNIVNNFEEFKELLDEFESEKYIANIDGAVCLKVYATKK